MNNVGPPDTSIPDQLYASPRAITQATLERHVRSPAGQEQRQILDQMATEIKERINNFDPVLPGLRRHVADR